MLLRYDYISMNWGRERIFYYTSYLANERAGAFIKPHKDRPDKLISLLFFTPPKPLPQKSAIAHGTLLLTAKKDFSDDKRVHHEEEDFEVSKIARYTPNKLLCWSVNENASIPRPSCLRMLCP